MSLIETTADGFDPFIEPASRIEPEVEDIRMINALAAYQLAYGQPVEALALLTISRRYRPDDEQTLRLLVQSFVQIEDWEKAEAALAALERVAPRRRQSARLLLTRAVVLLRRFRAGESRSVFREFLQRFKGGIGDGRPDLISD
ncbi:MAG: hypothetical protein R3D02_08980 [Hyphomicrobiales bacterium]